MRVSYALLPARPQWTPPRLLGDKRRCIGLVAVVHFLLLFQVLGNIDVHHGPDMGLVI